MSGLNNKIAELESSIAYYEQYIAGLESNDQVVATFEFNGSGKKLINVTEKTSAVLDELKYISELENSLKNDYKDFDIPGVHYDVTSSDGMVNITANFEIDVLPSNFRESIPYNNKTYEELKAYLEQDGYTCN